VGRAAGVGLVLGLLLYAGIVTLPRSTKAVHEDDEELSWIVKTVRTTLPRDAIVVARKIHLGFHANVPVRIFPYVETLDALREALGKDDHEPLFVYFGSVESRTRPGLSDLADPPRAPDWLAPVAASPDPHTWALYRVALPVPDRRHRAPDFSGQ
jgi:hypothetical protein